MFKNGNLSKCIPRVPERLIIREEYFGALIFDRDSLIINEANHNTLQLLRIIDGEKTFSEIIQSYTSASALPTEKVRQFLELLLNKGLIEC